MSEQQQSPALIRILGILAGLGAALAYFAYGHYEPPRSKPAQNAALTAPAVMPAPIVAAVPATGARTKASAMDALMSLPELQAWSAHLQQTSGGKVHGALMEYDPAPRMVDGKSYWQFSFVENGATAARTWESFLVAREGNTILVDDFATDKLLSLDQWRKQRHPMQRTHAQDTDG